MCRSRKSRWRDSLFAFFESWDHLPSPWEIFRCIRARAPSNRNRNTTAAQHLSSNHLLTFMMPPRFLLCGGQLRSADRNDQLPVRICMESESPARGKDRASNSDDRTLSGNDVTHWFTETEPSAAVLSVEAKPYSAVLCSGFEISSP